MAIRATFTPDGPIALMGDLSQLELVDPTGQKIDISGEKRIYLCRCGASVTKPFCDGHHSEIGFQAAEAAVKAEG